MGRYPRLGVTLLVAMEGVQIQYQARVLWNVIAIVYKIFGRDVRCRHEEGWVDSLNFLDERPDVWELFLILSSRPSLSSNDLVKLLVCALLDIWVRRDECEEPEDDTSSLRYCGSALCQEPGSPASL